MTNPTTSDHSVPLTQQKNKEELTDVERVCVECGQTFVWSVEEQIFFHDKGLKNPPKRCSICKKRKNERIEAILALQKNHPKGKIEVVVYCAKCGILTTVPFYPTQGKPVYCRSCFLAMNPDLLKPTS
jgi:CxxC-x17-CxxC domain-containing protein